MKIINNTNLKTDQLQNLIKEVAKRELVDLKDATFTIVYRRISRHGAYIGGFCFYGMPARVTLKVPKDIPIDRVELAFVTSHELCHAQNLHHAKMKSARYSICYAVKHNLDWRQYYLYANDFPIEREAIKPVTQIPKNIIIQQKRDKCLKMVNKWDAKIKSANKIYKKWKQKSIYYCKQLENDALIPTH